MNLNETVRMAFELWLKLTGKVQELGDESGVRIRHSGLFDANRNLKDSATLDPTGLLTLFLLDYYLEDYLSQWELPAILMLGPDYVSPHLRKQLEEIRGDMVLAKELFDLLRSEDLNDARDEFRAGMLLALDSCGVDREDVFDVLEEKHALAFLRRDALRAIQRLQVHQFMQGDTDGKAPIYHKDLYRFWNVNSMIRAFCNPGTSSGVAMCIMWEPEAQHSYFAFGVKNGGTVSVLTDKSHDAHPLAKSMSRSRAQGRRFDERASTYHFPYQVLGIDVNEKGDMSRDQTHRTGLVMYQERPEPLTQIVDLEPQQVIWAIMMYTLIKNKFWVEGFRTPLLSYTGEMVRVPQALGAGNALMKLSDYKPLELPAITVDVATNAALIGNLGQWGEGTGENEWLVERFKDRVSEVDLNRVGPDEVAYLPLPASVEKHVAEAEESLAKGTHLWLGPPEEIKAPYRLQTLDATKFGTATEIDADRHWVARYNLAKQINRAAHQEFAARKAEVQAWFNARVTANAPALLQAIAHGELMAPDIQSAGGFDQKIGEGNILGLWRRKKRDEKYDQYIFGNQNAQGHGPVGVNLCHEWKELTPSYSRITRRACYVTKTGGDAPYLAYFQPQTSEAVALVCGCMVDDLPDVLRTWKPHKQYSGNSTLHRIDPVDWVIKNPWFEGMNFRVRVLLGKSGYNQIRREAGLPPHRFWSEGDTD